MNGWLLALAIGTGVLGVARFTRIVTYEDYPPAVWVRITWSKITRYGGWSKLATCLWCASPYVAVVCLISGWYMLLTPLAILWWIVWGSLAASQVAAMILVRDEPPAS